MSEDTPSYTSSPCPTLNLGSCPRAMSAEQDSFPTKVLTHPYDRAILNSLQTDNDVSHLHKLFTIPPTSIENKLLVAESDVQNIDRDVKKHALHNYHLFIEAASCVTDTETAARQLHQSLARTHTLTNNLVKCMSTPLSLPTPPTVSSSLSQAQIQLQHAALLPAVIFNALRTSSLQHVIALWKKFATMLSKAFDTAHSSRQYSPLLFSLLVSLMKTRKAINISRLTTIASHRDSDAIVTQPLLWEPLTMPSSTQHTTTRTSALTTPTSTSTSTSVLSSSSFPPPPLYPRAVLAVDIPKEFFPADMRDLPPPVDLNLAENLSVDLALSPACSAAPALPVGETATAHAEHITTEVRATTADAHCAVVTRLLSLPASSLANMHMAALAAPLYPHPPSPQLLTLAQTGVSARESSILSAQSSLLSSSLSVASSLYNSYLYTRDIVDTAVTSTTFTNRLCAYAMNRYLPPLPTAHHTHTPNPTVQTHTLAHSTTTNANADINANTTPSSASPSPWWLDTSVASLRATHTPAPVSAPAAPQDKSDMLSSPSSQLSSRARARGYMRLRDRYAGIDARTQPPSSASTSISAASPSPSTLHTTTSNSSSSAAPAVYSTSTTISACSSPAPSSPALPSPLRRIIAAQHRATLNTLARCLQHAPSVATLQLILLLLKYLSLFTRQFQNYFATSSSSSSPPSSSGQPCAVSLPLACSLPLHATALIHAAHKRLLHLLDLYATRTDAVITANLSPLSAISTTQPQIISTAPSRVELAHSIVNFTVQQLKDAAERYMRLSRTNTSTSTPTTTTVSAALSTAAPASVITPPSLPGAAESLCTAPFLHARVRVLRHATQLVVKCVAHIGKLATSASLSTPAASTNAATATAAMSGASAAAANGGSNIGHMSSSVTSALALDTTASKNTPTPLTNALTSAMIADVSSSLRALAHTLSAEIAACMGDMHTMQMQASLPLAAHPPASASMLASSARDDDLDKALKKTDDTIVDEYIRAGVGADVTLLQEATAWARECKEAVDVLAK